jgi:hypothetical protein
MKYSPRAVEKRNYEDLILITLVLQIMAWPAEFTVVINSEGRHN